MAAGIVGELRKETGNSSINGLTGFFFCRSTDDRMNNAVDVLKGIIRTLWEQQQSLKDHVHHDWIEEEQKFDKDFNKVASLWNLLEKMTKHIGHQRVHIVIDAIDECSDHVEHLLRLIHTAGLVSPPNVKWLITSRPLSLSLQGAILSCYRPMQIDLDSFTTQVDDAVQKYIKLKTGWMELSRFSVDDQAQICELLLTKSESTFLWVAFVCREVRSLPASEVIRAISAMPKGLYHLYEKNIQLLDEACHDSNEFAIDYRKLVWTLYNLSGSPHLPELSVLAGLPREKASDESYLIRVIRECNTFMVLTDSDAVMLVHKSVKDYLDELQPKASGMAKLPSQGSVARQCMMILERTLRKNVFGLRELDSEAKEARLELLTKFSSMAGYSCLHWIEHIIKAGVPCADTVHGFLRQHFLHWLEAISILGRYRPCLKHLIQLDFTLEAVPKDQKIMLSSTSPLTRDVREVELHELIRRTQDFAVTSSNVIERWPLQVYSSASIFFVSESDHDEVFDAERPSWIVRRLRPKYHTRHLNPSVTVEHGCKAAPQIALSQCGEHSVTEHRDFIRLWRLEEPGQFVKLTSTDLKANPRRIYRYQPTIEGDQVKLVWVDLSVDDNHRTRWVVWNLYSGEQTGKGSDPLVMSAPSQHAGSDLPVVSENAAVLENYTIPFMTMFFFPVHKMSFSSDGKMFATVDMDAEFIRIWSAPTGEALSAITIKGYVDKSYDIRPFLRFCCCNKPIVYTTRNVLLMFNVNILEVVASIDDLDPSIIWYRYLWTLSEDGDYFAYGTGHSIRILETATNCVIQTIPAQGLVQLSLSTAPLRMAAALTDGTVRIWNIDSPRKRNLAYESSRADDSLVEYEREESRPSDYLLTNSSLPSTDNKKLVFLHAQAVKTGTPIVLEYDGVLLAYTFSQDSRMFAVCFYSRSPAIAIDLYIDGYLGLDMHRSFSTSARLNIDYGSAKRASGICLTVSTLSEVSPDEPPPRTLIQDSWTVNASQNSLTEPVGVAIAFSEDQSLLLYSLITELHITVGTINSDDHEEKRFVLDCLKVNRPLHIMI